MEVVRELVLPAPPGEVWEALTDTDRLAEWFANEVELELAPGGEGVFRWENGEARRAVVEEIEVGRRLAIRWWDEEAEDDATRVTFTVEESPDGTRLVVTEEQDAPTACAGEWVLALELRALLGRSAVAA